MEIVHRVCFRDVCMESTGKYWIPVFNILESDCNVVLSHPKYVKSILGKKTDKNDSEWISELFKIGIVKNSFIPPPDIRQLRDLMRYRYKLTNYSVGEKNRLKIFKPPSTARSAPNKPKNCALSALISSTWTKPKLILIPQS